MIQSVLRFLWGSFRVALKVALDEIIIGYESRRSVSSGERVEVVVVTASHAVAQISLGRARFDKFAAGHWHNLIMEGNCCAQEAATASRRSRRRSNWQDCESRASRALKLVQLGELSAGRQALEGADSAPRTPSTLAELRRRPAVPREPVLDLPRDTPLFNLDETVFGRNVRSARRGAAGGPSGMICDHLRPLLSNPRDLHKFFLVAEKFLQGEIPRTIVQIIKLGRMTALRKKDGGVRGMVVGEVIRRLTARTMAQQLGPAIEAATAPFQHVLSTRAGECVSHALQAICELDEDATVTSIDGISAYDTISSCNDCRVGTSARRQCCIMFCSVVLFRAFRISVGRCGRRVHTIHQGEGGEQGDPLVPLLFSVGQHDALSAIHEGMRVH